MAFDEPVDPAELGTALADCEWIIHAASQDLACLAEIGLLPPRLFDTELAARLLGYPRVALGTMIEELLGVRLLKEHSAVGLVDPPAAARVVDLRRPGRGAAHRAARPSGRRSWSAAGKDEWAAQEFAALAAGAGPPAEPRVDPWRRTSGIHRVRTRRGLAYVAALWRARDEIARARPGAGQDPAGRGHQRAGRTWSDRTDPAISGSPISPGVRPGTTRPEWVAGLRRTPTREPSCRCCTCPAKVRPSPAVGDQGPGGGRATRPGSARCSPTLAAELDVPVENLLTPDYVRRLAWSPPDPLSADSVDAALAELGARPWQRRLTVPFSARPWSN